MSRGAKPGERRGGRAKGTPNKKTQIVMDILESLDCNPIYNLAMMAMGEPIECLTYVNKETGEYVVDSIPGSYEQIKDANKELANYVYPKRKAVEHTGQDGKEIVVQIVRYGDGKASK